MIQRSVLLFLLFLSVPCILFAQESDRISLLRDIEYLASDELEGRKPLTEGSRKAQEYIKTRFANLGLTSQFRDYSQFFDLKERRGEGGVVGKATNIIGFIPGEQSKKLIVITAHYDHLGTKEEEIFNGADDNASGTAGLLALAEYFSKNKPQTSILFAALDGEEMGLQGARALVRDFPFPLEDVLLNINLDMISRSEKNELYAAGTYHYPQLISSLDRASKEAEVTLRLGHDKPGTGADDWTNASDHAAFHEKGIPFVYFGVEDHKDYHKATDTYDRIDQVFYYNAVNLIVRCVKELDQSFSSMELLSLESPHAPSVQVNKP